MVVYYKIATRKMKVRGVSGTWAGWAVKEPRFWQNRRPCREAAATSAPHYVLKTDSQKFEPEQ